MIDARIRFTSRFLTAVFFVLPDLLNLGILAGKEDSFACFGWTPFLFRPGPLRPPLVDLGNPFPKSLADLDLRNALILVTVLHDNCAGHGRIFSTIGAKEGRFETTSCRVSHYSSIGNAAA